jgi:hypothetical protein
LPKDFFKYNFMYAGRGTNECQHCSKVSMGSNAYYSGESGDDWLNFNKKPSNGYTICAHDTRGKDVMFTLSNVYNFRRVTVAGLLTPASLKEACAAIEVGEGNKKFVPACNNKNAYDDDMANEGDEDRRCLQASADWSLSDPVQAKENGMDMDLIRGTFFYGGTTQPMMINTGLSQKNAKQRLRWNHALGWCQRCGCVVRH